MVTAASPAENNDLRDRILSAAKRIFLEGAPETATMDAVAQSAGMSKKTIYREFKSQLELMITLMKETRTDFGQIPPPDPNEPLDEQLTRLIVRVVSYVMAPNSMALIRLIVSEIRRYPELLNEHRERGLPVEVVADWFRHDIVKAAYNFDDPEDAAAMVVGMVVQDAPFKLIFLPTETLPDEELERRARIGVSIFLRGISKA